MRWIAVALGPKIQHVGDSPVLDEMQRGWGAEGVARVWGGENVAQEKGAMMATLVL
jgi:hypothetical protein